MSEFNFYYWDCDEEISQEMSKLLCIPQEVIGLNVEIEYRYIPGWPGSHWEPPEYEEIELLSILVTNVETSTGEFKINAHQSDLIDYLVDWEVIEDFCFRNHKAEEEDYPSMDDRWL